MTSANVANPAPATTSFKNLQARWLAPETGLPAVANPSGRVVSIRRRGEGRQLVDVTRIVLNNDYSFQVAGNLLEPVQ
jgi:hypothetical protein